MAPSRRLRGKTAPFLKGLSIKEKAADYMVVQGALDSRELEQLEQVLKRPRPSRRRLFWIPFSPGFQAKVNGNREEIKGNHHVSDPKTLSKRSSFCERPGNGLKLRR